MWFAMRVPQTLSSYGGLIGGRESEWLSPETLVYTPPKLGVLTEYICFRTSRVFKFPGNYS